MMVTPKNFTVNFFEEYLKPENLSKLNLVKHKSILFLACEDLDEFNQQKKRIEKDYRNITAGYWPILDKSYWISPFAPTRELKRIHEELEMIDRKTPILLDMELPLRVRSYFRNLFLFGRHKQMIRQIVKLADEKELDMYYCENPSTSKKKLKLLRFLSVSLNPEKHKGKLLVMYYTSMKGEKTKTRIDEILKKFAKEYKKRLVLGLGTTATGQMGDEPKISLEHFQRDLQFSKRLGVNEVFVFRLGGHDEKYQEIIEKEMKKTIVKSEDIQ
ncbi:MAG: hypothetical protein ACLFTH_03830 [Candidatus Woesearchaeota archaeon]